MSIIKNQRFLKYWNIVNLVLLVTGLLLTWSLYGFEPPPLLVPVPGWKHIFNQISVSLNLLSEYGFAWLWFLSLLQGISGTLVIIYAITKICRLINVGFFIASKFFFTTLLLSLNIFFLADFVFAIDDLPLPGYWIFMIGLVSSIIFEWRNTDFK